jgi:hypothetical protein
MRIAHWIAAATLFASTATTALAAPIVGTMGAKEYGGYMGTMSNIQALDRSAMPDEAFVICIDAHAHYPSFGSAHHYNTSDSAQAAMRYTDADAGQTTSLLHYALDHYFAPMRDGAFGPFSGHALNQLMWELTSDFDGSVNSLSTTAGAIYVDPGQSLFHIALDDLRANFDSIVAGYRSSTYDVWFLVDNDSSYQSLMMISEREGNEVPLPSTAALMLAGGLALVLRKRRQPQR